MNWLSRVRNALPFMAKRETEGNLWNKCPSCSQMVFIKEYEENLSSAPFAAIMVVSDPKRASRRSLTMPAGLCCQRHVWQKTR